MLLKKRWRSSLFNTPAPWILQLNVGIHKLLLYISNIYMLFVVVTVTPPTPFVRDCDSDDEPLLHPLKAYTIQLVGRPFACQEQQGASAERSHV